MLVRSGWSELERQRQAEEDFQAAEKDFAAAEVLVSRCVGLAKAHKHDEAIVAARQAIAALEELKHYLADRREFAERLYAAYFVLYERSVFTDRESDAEVALSRLVELYRHHAGNTWLEDRQRRRLAEACFRQARRLRVAGRTEEGERWINEGVRLVESEGYLPHGRLTYLDLQPVANTSLTDISCGVNANNDLEELPRGDQTFAGVGFRVGEGLVHLAGKALPDLPERVEGIEVDRPFTRLYILHGCQWGSDVADGTVLGHYEVRYEDRSAETIPIVQGEDVRDWHNSRDKRDVTRGRIAWIGVNENVRVGGIRYTLRLYLGVWVNPHPTKKVASIACSSTNTSLAAPFCVAMTVEALSTESSNR
jgi:hypothetical protein